MEDFAPGLPFKTRRDSIDQKGPSRLVIQQHKARTDHFDLRLQDGDIAHSWVIRSPLGEKNKTLAVRQPTHRADYMDFEGSIIEGYGKGDVKKVYDKNVDVISADNSKIHLATPSGDELTLVKTKYSPDAWLLIKNNKTQNPVTSKPKYKVIDGPVDFSDEKKVLQPKVDGAHTIFHLKSNGLNRVYSYRNRKGDDSPIEHTHQVPEIRDMEVPKELNNTVLRGELYAQKDGRPVPAEEIGGMLNSGFLKSRETQKVKGSLKPYIFDIVKFNGEDFQNKPYREKLEKIKLIEKSLPKLKAAETAFTADEKRELLELIKKNKHPDTKEGVVEWDLDAPTGNPRKLKLRDSHDVVIRDIFPAEDKEGRPKQEAGGFRYSWSPKGKIVGSVGTGFTKEKRIDMFQNPDDYIGRIARIKAQEVFNSGAMRAPSFYTMDVEKNLEKTSAHLKEIKMNKQAALKEVYNSALENELEKMAVSGKGILSALKKGLKKAWTPFEANEEAIWRAGKRRDFIGKGNSAAERAKRNKLRNLLVRTGIIGTPIAGTAGAVIPASIASSKKKKKS